MVKYAARGQQPQEWVCDALAVCSGLHVEPNIPHIEGIENVPTVFHSSEFKSRAQFGTDKTILVVGSGETGADLAYLAVTGPTRQVLLSHRDGTHFAAKVTNCFLFYLDYSSVLMKGVRETADLSFCPSLGGSQIPTSRASPSTSAKPASSTLRTYTPFFVTLSFFGITTIGTSRPSYG